MEAPTQTTLEKDKQFCREILQIASTLEKDEVCRVWFKTAARKNQIVAVLESYYGQADLSKIQIVVYH
jgi:hypothetical protein